MILKLAILILLIVVALAMVGRALPRRKGPGPKPVQAMRKCPDCGAWGMPGEPCATPGCGKG